MGKLLTRLPRLTLAQLRTLRSTTESTCRRDLESSHGPDGNSLLTCNSTLAIQLGSNPVPPGKCVCSRSKVPIAPMGISHVSRLCLQDGGVYIWSGTVTFSSCTITGNTASVRAHVRKFPSPRWEFLLTCPIDSHLSIWIDIRFYQGNVRASHACKLPIAPMGK